MVWLMLINYRAWLIMLSEVAMDNREGSPIRLLQIFFQEFAYSCLQVTNEGANDCKSTGWKGLYIPDQFVQQTSLGR